jgi:phosphatidylethanolamine/phosphatidyl-N-methylethanolamine N-methyltransferase
VNDFNASRGPAPSASRVYHRFAHVYESLFGPVYTSRIHATIGSLPLFAGARVLEIGVGTGISLSAYPPTVHVTGIDMSQEMLDQAARKIEERNWSHVELRQMDALDLKFDDEHFDFVLAFHVASVVQDVHRMMSEMLRVCKPNGTIVVINHLRSEKAWMARLIDKLNPLTRRLGWRTDLRFRDLVDNEQLQVEKHYKTSPTSLFTVVVGRKVVSANRGAHATCG